MNRYLTNRAVEKRLWEIPVGLLCLTFAAVSVEVWVEDSPADENPVIWLLAHLTVVGAALWPVVHFARNRLRQRLAQRIARRLEARREASIPLSALDGAVGVKGARGKIEDLLRRSFLQRLALDGKALYLDDPGADDAPEASAPAPTADVIEEIRRLNDEIDDGPVSERIERIERATAGILQTLRERPERAEEARRFVNYYLPTTLKLLESYRLMEKQSYQGENIRASRRQIEGVLDKIVAATEQLQDRLYRAEAMDVEAEITVLETMMASDGLAIKKGQ